MGFGRGRKGNKINTYTPREIWQSAGKDKEDGRKGRESIPKTISLPFLLNRVKALPVRTWLRTWRFTAAPLILPLDLIPQVWDSPTTRQKREKSSKTRMFIWAQIVLSGAELWRAASRSQLGSRERLSATAEVGDYSCLRGAGHTRFILSAQVHWLWSPSLESWSRKLTR